MPRFFEFSLVISLFIFLLFPFNPSLLLLELSKQKTRMREKKNLSRPSHGVKTFPCVG
jgi:hypothetical protein